MRPIYEGKIMIMRAHLVRNPRIVILSGSRKTSL